jgi:RNA polymerase sigma-70 factor (ECF subfamily)
MPPPTRDDKSLLDGCRAGSETAARELFDRYVERLMLLARRRIGSRMAARIDPEDVVQSVFRTFFCRLKEDRFQIGGEDDLCKLLVRITVHKTLRQVAFHRAAKRDPAQEAGHGVQAGEMLLQVMDEEPSAETVVAFLDQFEHLLDQLAPADRRILELRFQGHSTEDIARELGLYDRKIRRVLERVRAVAEEEGGLLP